MPGKFIGRHLGPTHRSERLIVSMESKLPNAAELPEETALLREVAEWLRAARSAVAFTGAGISTESGIPDYRSPGGVWETNRMVYFSEFLESAEARYEYWRQKAEAHRDFSASRPNIGHCVLAKWEQAGWLQGVITQNIDGLHQLAGTERIFELHGTARQVGCLSCRTRFDVEPWVAYFIERNEVPTCPECGGLLKHATISFGQQLDPEQLQGAATLARRADVFLAMGSSLVVEPAATLPRLAKQRGAKLIILNREATALDAWADAVLHASLGKTLERLDELLA
jgi:NAD-dependent deacetylase